MSNYYASEGPAEGPAVTQSIAARDGDPAFPEPAHVHRKKKLRSLSCIIGLTGCTASNQHPLNGLNTHAEQNHRVYNREPPMLPQARFQPQEPSDDKDNKSKTCWLVHLLFICWLVADLITY
jgi:hypothetical protein